MLVFEPNQWNVRRRATRRAACKNVLMFGVFFGAADVDVFRPSGFACNPITYIGGFTRFRPRTPMGTMDVCKRVGTFAVFRRIMMGPGAGLRSIYLSNNKLR